MNLSAWWLVVLWGQMYVIGRLKRKSAYSRSKRFSFKEKEQDKYDFSTIKGWSVVESAKVFNSVRFLCYGDNIMSFKHKNCCQGCKLDTSV